MENRHMIGQQVVSIEIPDAGQAFDTQNEVSSLCRAELFPALDRLFSRYTPEHEHWKIDELALDLGELSAENWQKEFISKTIEQVEEQLQHLEHKRKTADMGMASDTFQAIENNIEYIFLAFLKTGLWTWNSPIKSIGELEKELIISEHLLSSIIAIIQENPITLQRLIWQFSDCFLEKTLSFIPLPSNVFKSIFSNILWKSTCKKATIALKNQKQVEYFCSLAEATNSTCFQEKSHIFKQAFSLFLSKKEQEKWMFFAKKSLKDHTLISLDWINLLKEINHYSFSKNDTAKKIASEMVFGTEKKEDLKEEVESSSNIHHQQQECNEGIYIANAGLVLLHPFLISFFEKTNLLVNNQWENKEARQRGILLCQYLITGHFVCEEPNLSLNKLLCGLPLSSPLTNEIALTDTEKAETKNLLNAVLEYWVALKSTNLDELRGSFLARNGKLSYKNSQWLLQVEQRPYDMLLDHLPWGFSMIQNQFMLELLRVEWN